MADLDLAEESVSEQKQNTEEINPECSAQRQTGRTAEDTVTFIPRKRMKRMGETQYVRK